jgi:hypothetical protein
VVLLRAGAAATTPAFAVLMFKQRDDGLWQNDGCGKSC